MLLRQNKTRKKEAKEHEKEKTPLSNKIMSEYYNPNALRKMSKRDIT